jgi:hypothetical protein
MGAEPNFAILEDRDFLRRHRAAVAGQGDFAFKHALTRDVVYASLPRARRLQLHAGFAAWLEEAGRGRDEHAALLAHHYAEAVAAEGADMAWEGNEEARRRVCGKGVQWLQRAAELAIGRYELDEGVALLERALSLGPSPSEEVQIWRAVGRASALRYDGEGLWLAMGRAIERCSDARVRAELYSELAIETAIRSGIWTRRPDPERVNRWIDQALELAEPDSAARVKALIARSNFSPSLAAEAAEEACAIAGRLDDPDLRSWVWDACGIGAFVSGDYDTGREYEERRLEMLDEITDPDHVADIHYGPVSGYAWVGRFDDMRRLLRRHDQLTASLSPHHRLHGVAADLEAEELAAGWERVRELAPRAERDVAASLDTPCARGPRSLLICALAQASIGDEQGAHRLEETAEALGLEGYGHVLAAPRMRLALLRGDLDEVERLLAERAGTRIWHRGWLAISTHAARIDSLAALRRRDDLAPEQWPHVKPGTYLEPFLLRALGLVEEDETLIQRACERFDAMGLQWYGEQTPQLARSP